MVGREGFPGFAHFIQTVFGTRSAPVAQASRDGQGTLHSICVDWSLVRAAWGEGRALFCFLLAGSERIDN